MSKLVNCILIFAILFISGCGSQPPLTQQQRLQRQNWQNSMQNLQNNMLQLQKSIDSRPPEVWYPVGGSNNQNSTEWQERRARQQYYDSLGY